MQINTGDILNVKVVDALGRIILQRDDVSEDFIIDTQDFESATYFLVVENEGIQTTSKLSVIKE